MPAEPQDRVAASDESRVLDLVAAAVGKGGVKRGAVDLDRQPPITPEKVDLEVAQPGIGLGLGESSLTE